MLYGGLCIMCVVWYMMHDACCVKYGVWCMVYGV